MRRILIIAGALALVTVPAIAAPKPPKPPKGTQAITIGAKPNPVVFSSPTAITGRLDGGTDGNVSVKLEKDETSPFGDRYVDTGLTTRTATNGNYTFSVKPGLNTQYRVVASASPPVTSAGRLVLVRPRVGLKTAKASSTKVRFSGSVYPALDGRSVLVQRRSPSGRFVTVARTTLKDAGTVRSSYSRLVTVSRDGVYRTKVPGDAKHVNGFSTTRSVSAP